MILVSIFLFIFYSFVIIIIGTYIWGGILAAPWVPLRKRDIKRMLALADLRSGQIMYDLGCGDGRLLIAAYKQYNARPIGFEISVFPYLIAKIKIFFLGLGSKVTVKYQNFYNYNLADADAVTMFLMPKAFKKLKPKLLAELKPGCRIVSYTFKIPDLQPEAVDKPNPKDLSIYVYQKK